MRTVHSSLFLTIALALPFALRTNAAPVGSPGPLSGVWDVKLTIRETPSTGSKPATFKETDVLNLSDSTGATSSISGLLIHEEGNIAFEGTRYGNTFHLHSTGNENIVITGEVKTDKNGVGKTFSGEGSSIDDEGISRVKLSGKRTGNL